MKDKYPCIVRNALKIEVYVIGYKGIGESIVLFIKADSLVIFSAVVDSYCYCGENKTIEILNKNSVDKIDYFCWSHPDEDHSLGIDELFHNYIDEDTLINIPEDVEINKNKCSERTIEIFNLLIECSKSKKKYKVYTISDFKDILAYENDFRVLYNDKEYLMKIESISPNSSLIRQELDVLNFNKNRHSIAFLLYFGKTVFFVRRRYGKSNNKTD